MRRSLRLVAGGGALAAALTGIAAPAQAHVRVAPAVLSTGHVDAVDVEYEDGELELAVHAEDTDTEYAPADVVLLVKRQAKAAVPDDPAYAFLGEPGDNVWILPEVRNPDLLWAGLSAEELESGVFAGDAVSVNVQQVRGPGDVSVFAQDAVGSPDVLVNSADGLPDTLGLAAGQHEHVNWAFERSGTYKLTVTASATLAATGETITSEPATYTFKVQR
ncbi:choice-of-anchor M domain-containing protein [Actinoplanes sp. RD1]|uniref:choice-of-anchor M domain-containing protein n=1 Tax=Actinoplanes sp. RD1 TaxID=3064538 RepID=UPI002741EDAF|nr:choice-of-anchor M domain-containing protein [Actinoplanes sp. RD1]